MPTWAVEFHPFTWMHALTVAWSAAAVVVSVLLGRNWVAQGGAGLVKERTLAAAWAGFVVCVNLWSIVYWHLPGEFDIKVSLPIQLCDIACLIAPLVFLTEWRTPRALIFFWGLSLSIQAFVTPTLEEGPAHMKYSLFWLVHLSIVGSAVYDLAVRRYRPTLRDLLVTIAATVLYALAMIAVNHRLDSNYGLIGNQLRSRPTPIDLLGPWPQRVFILAGIVIGLFIAMWAIARVIDAMVGRSKPRADIWFCTQCGHDLSRSRADNCPACGAATGDAPAPAAQSR